MNRILGLALVGIMLVFSSCETSQSYDGTYEGILPAADCPGIYMLLAIHGDQYELMEKYIMRAGIFVTYGKIQNVSSCKLRLDNEGDLTFHGDTLLYRNVPLKRVSFQKELPDIYKSQFLKENQSGEDATVSLYEMGNQRYADFYFKDKEYKLKLNPQNNSEDEYIDKNCSLKILFEDEYASVFGIPVFNDGKNSYTFTALTPTNNIYISETKSHVPSFFDVIYYNDGMQAFVKLITSEIENCYTLPQTDASSKTADYSDGKIKWQLGNHQDATLIIDDKEYKYREQ